MTIKSLFFGVGNEPGHYWWQPGARPDRNVHTVRTSGYPDGCPFGWECDGGLQPADPREVQGRCRLIERDGWTAIAWWDRSVDKRMACCSTFAAEGIHRFDTMLALLKESFPWVLARAKFELVLVDEPARTKR
jgi:hypothetical protein